MQHLPLPLPDFPLPEPLLLLFDELHPSLLDPYPLSLRALPSLQPGVGGLNGGAVVGMNGGATGEGAYKYMIDGG